MWLDLIFPSIYQRYFKKPSQLLLPNDEPHSNLNNVVMGHTHIPVIQDHIIDCGDFVDSASYVILNDGVPELKFI